MIKELYMWQKQVIADAEPSLSKFDTRKINIIYDPTGNHGKSILKTWIGVYRIGVALPYSNDYRDIMRAVMARPARRLYIVDMPRAINKEQLNNFWSGIEDIKNGYAFDDRYHFKETYFDCPNVWVMTNTWPEIYSLSPDRWVIWGINEITLELIPLGNKHVSSNVDTGFQALRCNSVPENPPNSNLKIDAQDARDNEQHDNIKISDEIFTPDGFLNI